MKASAGVFRLSASDLSNHLACRHLTSLDFEVALGEKSAPAWHSPDLWVLQKRGLEHEAAYIAFLAAQGLSVVDLRTSGDAEAKSEATAGVDNYVDFIAAEASSETGGSDEYEQ